MSHIETVDRVEDVRILRILRIAGPDWNRFTAYLPYTRSFERERFDNNTGYDRGDVLDETLLAVIKQAYPRTDLYRNKLLLFKGDLENELQAIRGGVDKPSTIRLHPLFSYTDIRELLGRTFPVRETELTLRVHLAPGHEKLEHIYSDFICSLHPDQLVGLWKTFQAV